MKNLRIALLTIALVAAALVNAQAGSVTVTQKDRTFIPESVDISVGDTIVIRNDDMFLHQVYVKSPDRKSVV